MSENFYIYMMSNFTNKVLYVGFTSDLVRRVWEHQHKLSKGFTEKYNVNKLVWYECVDDYESALSREKQIKGWKRAKKDLLINTMNPRWTDLAITMN